ncbi:MAG: DNA-binding protein WhiA [Clostridia bacterium]|nr:DNA-binding protein WhiA [Clostridia bacterium]
MSFSSTQKDFIISQIYKSPCCKRALLYGVALAKGVADGEYVTIAVEKCQYAEFISNLAKELFSAEGEISTAHNGGRRYLVSFRSKSLAKYVSELKCGGDYLVDKCDFCLPSFLRGLFLASGRVSSPEKQFSLEFSLGERCEMLLEFLSGLGIRGKIYERKSERLVYVRVGSDIEDFFGFARLNQAMFTFMDAKAAADIRKGVMRVANCETRNITKAVDAARRQLVIIMELDKANLLSSLPEELEATARLRMEHADLTLSQLSAISVPKISKPGLSHRLKRIMEIGAQLLEGRKA